jgi:hypothetical protein
MVAGRVKLLDKVGNFVCRILRRFSTEIKIWFDVHVDRGKSSETISSFSFASPLKNTPHNCDNMSIGSPLDSPLGSPCRRKTRVTME